MKKSAYLLFVILLHVGCQKPKETTEQVCLMAYYMPSAKTIDTNALPLQKLTHIIYSFTEVVNNRMEFVDGISDKPLKQLVAAKKDNPHLKVMLACGGWSGSGGFSTMAETAKNRSEFVQSTLSYIKQYQLDGIDLDWEYPGLPGIGNKYQPDDKTNFTHLIKELRTAMDEYQSGLVLTFASAGWQKYFNHIELVEVMQYVDYMNIMTYDLSGPETPVAMHHTNLYGLPFEQVNATTIQSLKLNKNIYESRSVDDIVKYCLLHGIDSKKIVIGAAFYAKSWKGVEPTNNGLHQSHKGFKGFYSYQQIKDLLSKNEATRYWDEVAQAPFVYQANDSVFITYDDPESLRLKVEYAQQYNLGGVMFWQLRSDNEQFELTDALYDAVSAIESE